VEQTSASSKKQVASSQWAYAHTQAGTYFAGFHGSKRVDARADEMGEHLFNNFLCKGLGKHQFAMQRMKATMFRWKVAFRKRAWVTYRGAVLRRHTFHFQP
jgi:hypothetical protein